MTNSEKLLSSFSENYFYKELVYADLKFTPIGGTEIGKGQILRSTPNTAPLICGACNIQPEGLLTTA